LEFENKGPPEIRKEEIEYLEKIGGGCFGHVFRGKCRGKEVAVKKLFRQDMNEQTLASFKKEVEFCSRLHHPNVVLFMGACTEPGHMAIVTELMPKGNLETALRDEKLSLTLFSRLKMAKDTALGINWLHLSNPQIIHRDLKPSNLLLDANYTVKVCDFGLSAAKPYGDKIKDKDSIPGTPLWMAPEVMMGQPLDEKSDVYSYGMCLWEIVTKQEPFPEMDSYPVFKRAITKNHQRPPIPKDTLPSLRQLIERCWDKEPSARPSFAEIIPILDQVIVDVAIPDVHGRNVWKKNFLGQEKVLYEQFLSAFLSHLGLLPTAVEDLTLSCFKAVMSVKDDDKSYKDPPDVVYLERFGQMLGFFGPIEQNTVSMQRIKNTLKQPWFHGDISKTAAEEKLISIKKGRGSFLVRFSFTTSGCFTISKVSTKGGINHQRIDYKPGKGFSITYNTKKGKKSHRSDSLVDLITMIKADLHLKTPCPNNPYEHLFSKAKTPLEGYLGVENDSDYSE